MLQLNDKGKPLPNTLNAKTLLTTHPAAAGLMRYNAFKQSIEYRGRALRTWTSPTCVRNSISLARSFQFDLLYRAFESVAFANTYHPVRDYLAWASSGTASPAAEPLW
jgi:hypothetical protein